MTRIFCRFPALRREVARGLLVVLAAEPVLSLALVSSAAHAETIDDADYDDESAFGADERPSYYRPARDPNKPRNYVLSPLASFLLPGFDQWWEGQYGAALGYTGLALSAESFSLYHRRRYLREIDTYEYQALPKEAKENRNIHGERERKILLGDQIRLASGSFSAYHSFRTAVTTQQRYGRFTFLKTEETPWDLFKAPAQFQFLARPSTYIPLSIIAGLHLFFVTSEYGPTDKEERDPLTRSDAFFTGATSYLAGTHEEALFRGYMLPVLMQWTGSPFWSNTIQSLIFAAAHLKTVEVPVAQLLLGWHLGNVTIDNDWTLAESIFIHAWWDVFALLSTYQVRKKVPDAKLPTIWLPPLEINF